jgi:pilus assembly protein CpaB
VELTEVQKEADSAGRKAIYFGVVALFLAGVFGYALAQLNSGGPETQSVVVAAENIPSLSHIAVGQLRVVPWPAQSKPKNTFAKPEDVVKTNMIVINGLLAGEPILQERLSPADRGLGMSQMVEPNMRAFVVQVLDSVAFADLLHPHAFVDVLATMTMPKSQEVVTKVLLQNIQVIAVGDSIDVEASKPRDEKGTSQSDDRSRVERHRVVTLLVSLSDLEALTLASREGKIDLALRNDTDTQLVATPGVSLEQIIGEKRSRAQESSRAAAAAPDPQSAETHSMMPASKSHNSGPQHHRDNGRDNNSGGPAIYKVKH